VKEKEVFCEGGRRDQSEKVHASREIADCPSRGFLFGIGFDEESWS